MAMSLPNTAEKLLRLPSSWATEINFQSRYPEGISVTNSGAPSWLARRDAGAAMATTVTKIAMTTRNNVNPFIVDALLLSTSQRYQAVRASSFGRCELLFEVLAIVE